MIEPQVVRQERTLPHSVEVSWNAKREVSFTVKVYFETGEETEALNTVERIESTLRET